MVQQEPHFGHTQKARGRFDGVSGKAGILAAAAAIAVGASLAGTYWTSTAGGDQATPIAHGRADARPAVENVETFAEGPIVSSASTGVTQQNLDVLAEGPIVSSAASGPDPIVVLAAIAGGYQGGVHGDDLSVLVEGPVVSSAGR